MDDLISRQDATNTVKNVDVVVLYHDGEPIDEAIEEAIEAVKRSVMASIESLPSAQPERTDCTDCKEYDHETHSCPKYCRVIRQTLEEAKQERTGRWINIRHDNIAECDQCGITGRAWMNFCFDCGADMREGER